MINSTRLPILTAGCLPAIVLVLCLAPAEALGTVYAHLTPLQFGWTQATGNVDHYNVYVSTDGQTPVLAQQVSTNTCQVDVHDKGRYTTFVEAVAPSGLKGPSSDISEDVVVFLNGSEADTDGDGIDNDWETAFGLDSLDPNDATQDLDSDGLSNADEYRAGTLPQNPDTDGDGDSDGQETQDGLNPLDPADSRPVANAGPDQQLAPTVVMLDGAASYDPNGDPLSYKWAQTAGPTVSLEASFPLDPGASFLGTRQGLYCFRLVVNDGKVDSLPDDVAVTVLNVAPTADAGFDQVVDAGSVVQLDGSGSRDPNEDALTYAWSQTGGPPVLLQAGGGGLASFCPSQSGLCVFRLVVSDGELDSAADEVEVVVNAVNRIPTADAGLDQNGLVEQQLVLDGSGSADPDGDPLAFHWSQMEGPEPVVFKGQTSPQVSFTPHTAGIYIFQLRVHDGQSFSAADTTTVSIEDENHAPLAVIGEVEEMQVGAKVDLDGSSSYDPDGDPLNYQWSQTTGPSVSVSLESEQSPVASFYAVTPGVLAFQLTVDDGVLTSVPAAVEVVVNGANQLPVANAGTDLSGRGGQLVRLDGSASYDPDPGDSLSFRWFQSGGTRVTLQDADTASPSFVPRRQGKYVFSLVVSDGELQSARDQVLVNVSKK